MAIKGLNPTGSNPQATALVICNVSVFLSQVLFLEERMELKFWLLFFNHLGPTGVFLTGIRIKSFPRKLIHLLMLPKLRIKQGTPLPSSTAVVRHYLILFPLSTRGTYEATRLHYRSSRQHSTNTETRRSSSNNAGLGSDSAARREVKGLRPRFYPDSVTLCHRAS